MSRCSLYDWLDSRQSSYSDGLSFFRLYASQEEREKYLSYFEQVDDVPNFDAHFVILRKRLSRIAKERGGDIRLYATAESKEEAKQTVENDKRILLSIKQQERQILQLEDQISDIDDRSEDNEDRIGQVEMQIEQVNESIEEMKQQLSSRGARIVTFTSLPEHLKESYLRIRKITPLYAALFTEMQNESISNDERLKTAKEVYELWKERRDRWKEIDRWASETGVTLDLAESKPDDPNKEQLDEKAIKDRMERLRQNIRRTKRSIEMHQQNGKLNYLERSKKRLTDFELELNKLEEMSNGK